MKYKPGFFDGWFLALLVSVCITVLSLVLLNNVQDMERKVLLPVGVVVFWVAFLSVFAFLEIVVLRETKRIYKITQKKIKKKDKDQQVLEVEQPGLFNPMRRVYEEVSMFTNNKEQEIEWSRLEGYLNNESCKPWNIIVWGKTMPIIKNVPEDEKWRVRLYPVPF